MPPVGRGATVRACCRDPRRATGRSLLLEPPSPSGSCGPGTLGTHVAGPRWLTAGWPLLLDLPLAWRRLAPLPAWLFVLAGFAVHPLATGHSAEGAELLYPIGVGAHALAAYAARRAAVVGLIAFVPVYLVHAFNDPGVRHDEAGGQWASAFFGAAVIVVWFAGFWIHSRREAAALGAQRPPSGKPLQQWPRSGRGWRASCTTSSPTT
jgi:hypothetical protein